jgi:hypothetical protein
VLHASPLLNEGTLRSSLGKQKPAALAAMASPFFSNSGQASFMTGEDIKQLRMKHSFLVDFSD